MPTRLTESFAAFWERLLKLRIRWLLLLGLSVRILLIPFFSFTYDVSVWTFLTNDMLRGLSIYASRTFTYPPLWAYTLLPLTRILALFVNPATLSQIPDNLAPALQPGILQPVASPLLLTVIKLPLLLADLSGAYLTYKISLEVTTQLRAKAALALWLLNPAIIWASYGHGQFDIIPAVLTLAAAYLALRRHPVATGIALSLAILYKLYPLFLVPLYLVLLFVHSRDVKGTRIRDLLRFTAGLLAPALLFLLIPILLPINGNTGFLQDLSARGSLIASMGGLSPFSILNIAPLYQLKASLTLNSGLVNIILLSLEAALSLFIAGLMRRSVANDPLKASLHGHIFILAMLFLTLPLTTPQYLVWMMPFLILAYGVFGEFFKRIWILALLGFLFNPFLFGLGYPLYPSAVYLRVPSLSFLTSLNTAFAPYALPLVGLMQIIGFITILTLLKPNLSLLPATSPVNNTPHPQLNLKLPVQIERGLKLTTIFLIASLLFTVFNSYPSSYPSLIQPPKLLVNCCRGSQNSTYFHAEAELQLTGGTYPAQVNTLLLPLKANITPVPLYIYYDPSYPSSLTNLRGWNGLIDHLSFEFQQRSHSLNNPPSIQVINAVELAHLLLTNPDSDLILPSGVLPNTTNIISLKIWLQNGGTLFWLGDRIGYYTSGPSLTLNHNAIQNPGYTAQKQLFNGYILSANTTNINYSPTQQNPTYQAGTVTTTLQQELNLNYPETLVGANIQNLTKIGGTALGRINPQTNQTSIALIPVGSGKAILFGGGITYEFATSGEATVAADIAQIVNGAILDSTLEIGFIATTLVPNQSINATLSLTLKTSQPVTKMIFIAYSPNPDISFFEQTVYPPP